MAAPARREVVSMATGGLLRLATAPVSKMLGLVLRTPALADAPSLLYRAGFGWILGSRMVMLEHIGRKSGLTRHVVLEVLGHPGPETYVVASGFGESAQWFRNVMAEPHVRISTGRLTSAPALARRLPPSEADSALSTYVAAHPKAWSALKGIIEQALDGRVDPPGTELPLIELTVQAR